ncbi:uncharacterized protein [Blastocystis hominis]|uniref:Uncharacterized protein n=1 Tax=Blastocystis hominis TaxID=12968 RepID=D8M4I0_BLAHO|nr:uncharacterized protein [Blastocystis hominis]CBK22969.2 unnamed protein product [Blastocystis hominis]|eukprot:XP_012897017.1 uncharacterized protein [Blastocystis hominis]
MGSRMIHFSTKYICHLSNASVSNDTCNFRCFGIHSIFHLDRLCLILWRELGLR